MEALVWNLLSRFCIVVLILFHYCHKLLCVDSACKLGDDNDVLRVERIVLDLWERFNTSFPFTVFHDDCLAKMIHRWSAQEFCSFFKSRLKVVVLCSCNLYGVESLLYLECVYEVVHSFDILQGFFHRFYSCIGGNSLRDWLRYFSLFWAIVLWCCNRSLFGTCWSLIANISLLG